MIYSSKEGRLHAVTGRGLTRILIHGLSAETELLRPDGSMTCAAVDPADPGVIFSGSRGDGVWVTEDGGATWRDLELPASNVFSIALSPADGALYAGTEPSRLYRSRDRGGTWHEIHALRELPSAPTWSFPPRPWTSHVSSIAPHPNNSDLLIVGIELGGLMRTTDGGATWEDHRPGAQKDVHALAWHPRAEDRAYQAGGGGAAFSFDQGRTWRAADEGRDRHYTWALAVDPENPDLWFISASYGPRQAHSDGNADAHVYRRRGDNPWEALDIGLPAPMSSMPYALHFADGLMLVGLRDGRLFASSNGGDSFFELEVEGLAGLRAFA